MSSEIKFCVFFLIFITNSKKTSIFTSMKNIRKFSIKNNRLTWIPSAFTSKLHAATDINLSQNQLKIFKVNFILKY